MCLDRCHKEPIASEPSGRRRALARFDLGSRYGLFLPDLKLVRDVRRPAFISSKAGTVMQRWLIWLPVGVVLCGCQARGSVSDDCPTLSPCDEAGLEVWPSVRMPVETLVASKPLWPGCPPTLQVIARPHPIAYRAIRPAPEQEAVPDPSDWVCEAPEAPLLRVDRWDWDQHIAGR